MHKGSGATKPRAEDTQYQCNYWLESRLAAHGVGCQERREPQKECTSSECAEGAAAKDAKRNVEEFQSAT